MKNGDPHWTGKVELIESMLDLPIKWKKPRKIFVNSISDLFHESLPDEVIDRVFNVMAHCPQHTFIVLTKRHERMKQHLNKYWKDPLPNCWIGVSAGNQEMYNLRVPYLLDTPADVSFVSCEPLLGPIDITQVNGYPNWLILGGESGPGARPCDINWIDDIYIDCLFHNVPTFIKQLGAYPTSCGVQVNLKDRKGGNIEEFPSSLRVREFPKEK
jgi:protein gp37